MFERFSFSLSRIFRLRSRRGTKANVGSARVARRPTSAPPPSKTRRPDISQLKPIDTTLTPSTMRPRSFFIPSFLSPITQSPNAASPGASHIPDTLAPILIIGRDPAQPTPPSPPAPALPDDVGSQTHVDPPVLTHLNTHRVSFQLSTACADEPPDSPLSRVSTCSTLIPDVEADAGTGIRPAIPPEQSHASEAPSSDSVPVASVEPDAGLDDAVRSGSGRARPVSLFSPQPVRVDVSRFSLPVTPTTATMTASTNASDSRRGSKRISLIPWRSGSGSDRPVRKEKRMSAWSRELSKPETQEVLRALALRTF